MSIDDYDLFIFDWDGTLSTSTFIVKVSNLIRHRYRKEHIEKHKEEYISRMERRMKSSAWRNEVYAFLYDLYSAAFSPRLKPDSVEILDLLRKRKKKVAIFSDSESYRLMQEARQLKVLDHVDFILSASSIGYYKPNPSGLMLIADKYRIPKRKCVYIGDMPTDIATAKFAGMASCAVGDGLAPYSSLKEAAPNYLYRSIGQMLREISS